MYEPIPVWTCLIILVTCVTSFIVFRNRKLEEKYVFWPEGILAWKEYYRIVSSAFLHADGQHLFFNMLTLYMFGRAIEWREGAGQLLAIYFGAIVGGSLVSLWVHRHHDYRAYGASGGTCGVVFAYILLFPGGTISMFFIPIGIPGWLYAIGYLLYSFFSLKEHRSNIGHDAHLGGAIIGLLIAAILDSSAVTENLWLFLTVLITAVVILVYLWMNPMFLPLSAVLSRGAGGWRWPTLRRNPTRKSLRVDAVLEKISKHGIHSLTAEEKALLDETAGKYQRRADSKKPESGLPF